MAKLNAKKRNRLKSSTFAIPESRSYPINDRSHAANALARVSQHGTPEVKRRVRAKVKSKYGMGPGTSNAKQQPTKKTSSKSAKSTKKKPATSRKKR